MNRKTLAILVVLACALSVAAGSARANAGDRTTIVVGVQNIGGADCPESVFGLSFDLVSPAGAPLGTGTACIESIDDGCVPFVPGCRQVVRSTWTLSFASGSVTVPMKLRETWHTEASFTQRGAGRIAGARVKGGGSVDFATGRIDLVYTVRLKGDRLLASARPGAGVDTGIAEATVNTHA